MWPILFSLALSADQVFSEVAADEVVVFYPTYGRQTTDEKSWVLHLHGRIFEPEENSIKRAALLGLLRRSFRLSKEEEETATFKSRFAAFLVDNERNKTIYINLGNEVYRAGKSAPNGHFSTDLVLSNETIAAIRRQQESDAPLPFQAVLPAGNNRRFTGSVHLIERRGWSVISDFDDTIKVSDVRDRRALLANTFLRQYQPVPDMAPLYRAWQRRGVDFHYVSASPWQLYEPVSEFLRAEDFPPGSLHMKNFRLKDQSALALLATHHSYKGEVIAKILSDFPERRFVLIGDSGEQDPEIYAELARKHDQVARVLIRLVAGDRPGDIRFVSAFEGLDERRWQTFQDAGEIDATLP